MIDFIKEFKVTEAKEDYDKNGPSPDKVECGQCHRKWFVKDCPTVTEGDWETGYYDVLVCPKCEDDGELDNFYFSRKQQRLYDDWFKKQDKNNG